MKKCEYKDCQEEVFATAYPEDLNYKLCIIHFREYFQGLIEDADIVERDSNN